MDSHKAYSLWFQRNLWKLPLLATVFHSKYITITIELTLWYFIVFYHCITGEKKRELFTAIMRSNELKLFNYPTIIVIHVPLSSHWDSVSLWSGTWLYWVKLGHVVWYRKKRLRFQFINFWIIDKVKVCVESNWLTNW